LLSNKGDPPRAAPYFGLFSNFFASNPKVLASADVKESEAAERRSKIIQKYFQNTLKFLAALPLKVQKAGKRTEKYFRTTLKFQFWLT
jgi:hypothetical protein